MDIKPELNSLALDHEFINPKICIEEPNEKGQGYMGTIRLITINGENKSGNKMVLFLVAKSGLMNTKLRKRFMIKSIVAREMFFYKTVFPSLRLFESKHGILDSVPIAPKCYNVFENKEAIIMENLKADGYDLFNQQLEMDDRHVKAILGHYAKLHATSFALKVLEPNTFNDLTKDLQTNLFGFLKHSGVYSIFIRLIKNTPCALHSDKDAGVIKKLNAILINLEERIQQLVDSSNNPLLILHGDSWSNNILLKYNELGDFKQSISVRLVDFQFAYAGSSPVFDVASFFYVCAANDVMENLQIYQHFYHKEFSACLQGFGLDPEQVYPLTKFLKEWKEFAKFGLITASFFRFVMLQEPDEITNYNCVSETEMEINVGNFENIVNIQKYHERMRNVIVHLANNDFI